MEIDLQRFYNINRRAFMWIIFFAILFLLRDFFALVFLTFIFGFLMRHIALYLAARLRVPYWSAVVVPYLAAIGLLVLLTVTAIPRVIDEAARFSRQVPSLFETLAREVIQVAPRYNLERMLSKYVFGPAGLTEAAVPEDSGMATPAASATTFPAQIAGEEPPPGPATAPVGNGYDALKARLLAQKLQGLALGLIPGWGGETSPEAVAELFSRLVVGIFQGVLDFLLAILLSFLIVLDYERIGKEIGKWQATPVGRFFHEAAANVVEFSGVVGSAFQCQMLVALLNACITCVGLFVLRIEPIVLLTTIVFLLGLIPVLGVFISSVPILLISFNDFGLAHSLVTLTMIVVVHLLEAYVFNPRIYAARFHLNPVIVLIILLTGEQLFGIWGMLLGIPVTHYVLNLAGVPTTRRLGPKASEPPQPVHA